MTMTMKGSKLDPEFNEMMQEFGCQPFCLQTLSIMDTTIEYSYNHYDETKSGIY